jgi:hypothetical protein
MTTTKTCNACEETKPLTDFYMTTSRGGKYPTARCRPCHNTASKAGHDSRMTKDAGYKVTRLLHSVRQRCGESGLPFDLDSEWLLPRYLAATCEVTGLPLNLFGTGTVGERPWGPSLDRIDQKAGYTKDNVLLVCWMLNRAKGSGSMDDVLLLAEALRNVK